MKKFQEKTQLSISGELIDTIMQTFNLSKEDAIRNVVERTMTTRTYENDKYKVVCSLQKTEMGDVVHLSICNLEREPIHNWRDLQTIKNMFVGEECFAYEVYPAETQLVDTANQYHLWCLPEGKRLPFGFNNGRNVQYNSTDITKQEPLKK